MNYFQDYLAEEFAEDYSEGRLTRRQALKMIASVTGSVVLANAVLGRYPEPAQAAAPEPAGTATPTPTPTPPPTPAPTPTAPPGVRVAADDPDIEAEWVEIPAADATLSGYLARPSGEGPFPVVLVCHENRGLTEHIQDVTRRLGKAGYVALAVDLLSRQGGTAALEWDEVPGVLGQTEPEQFVADFQSGWQYLHDLPYADADRVGMVGFCFGGGVTWRVAAAMPELKAAVPYYGPHAPIEMVPDIQAPVLAIYADRDERITGALPAIEAAMLEHGKTFEPVVYPDSDHAFHNDTGTRYNHEAARDAWARTLAWFAGYLVPDEM